MEFQPVRAAPLSTIARRRALAHKRRGSQARDQQARTLRAAGHPRESRGGSSYIGNRFFFPDDDDKTPRPNYPDCPKVTERGWYVETTVPTEHRGDLGTLDSKWTPPMHFSRF
jgi:hypothetical protein